MSDKMLIGIDIGGTTIKFAILDSKGVIQHRWSIQTNIFNNGNNIIPDISESVKQHLHIYNLKPQQFAGIGIGTPGSVNYQLGTVDSAFNLNWDRPMDLQSQIEANTQIPVKIENDANVAALGERWQGAGNNANDVIFVTLGTGVGGGIVQSGKIVHGNGGSAGEIGHMTINPTGYKCTCGKRGCLETVASATGIVRVAQNFASKYEQNSQLKVSMDNGDDLSAKDIFDYAKQNDNLAIEVIDYVCLQLGLALSNVAVILNPEYIIIGGGVSNAGNFLLNHIQKYYDQYIFKAVQNTTTLRLATLGNEAGVIGAASLILDN